MYVYMHAVVVASGFWVLSYSSALLKKTAEEGFSIRRGVTKITEKKESDCPGRLKIQSVKAHKLSTTSDIW